MKTKLFPYIIAMSALAVSASAAAYSVYGLSKLFAGASLAVMIMASSLEFAKLVIASALYQYWSKINKYIKIYLLFAILVLITITSGGIYGFLSGAYQETANQSELISKNLNILETKQNRYINRLKDIETNISDLTIALSNPTKIQYVDKETGQLVTTTSYTQRKVLEKQLIKAQTTFDELTDSVSIYDTRILETQSNNETARELGPLKYMASLFNKPMESIINWFMLLIIFVFDPLAIVLVVVANMAFSQKSISKSNQYFNVRNKALEKMVEQSKPKQKIIEKPSKISKELFEVISELMNSSNKYSNKDIEKLKTNLYGEKK